MSLWIHCNKCYSRYAPVCKFFVTDCLHVFCEKCLEKSKETQTCPLCNKHEPAAMMLSNDMPPSMKSLFGGLEGVLDKAHTVAKFQMKNCLNLLKQMMGKYNQLKIEAMKMNHAMNSLRNENKKLKQALVLSRSNMSRGSYDTSTPMSEMRPEPNSPFNNVTMSSVPNSGDSPFYPNAVHHRYPGQVQRMYHEKYGTYMKQSPVQLVPTHGKHLQSGGSRASSALSSMKHLSLRSGHCDLFNLKR